MHGQRCLESSCKCTVTLIYNTNTKLLSAKLVVSLLPCELWKHKDYIIDRRSSSVIKSLKHTSLRTRVQSPNTHLNARQAWQLAYNPNTWEVERRDLWNKLASQTSWISEFWVQMKDLAEICRVVSSGGRWSTSTCGYVHQHQIYKYAQKNMYYLTKWQQLKRIANSCTMWTQLILPSDKYIHNLLPYKQLSKAMF